MPSLEKGLFRCVLPIFDWAFQRKEIMPLAAMWMGLETVILGKVSQRGKENTV